MDAPPDLVLSGINSGSNVADDVTYSGTVAGAMEGTLLGIRSIALSQAYGFSEDGRIVPWDTAEELAPALLERLIGLELPKGVFLNVNFPNMPASDVKGTVVTRQGKLVHGLWIDERKDGRGFPYFWLRFGRKEEEIGEGSDQAAMRDGYVSISPLQLDLTAHEVTRNLTKALG
jgi:5'-nucleotidase